VSSRPVGLFGDISAFGREIDGRTCTRTCIELPLQYYTRGETWGLIVITEYRVQTIKLIVKGPYKIQRGKEARGLLDGLERHHHMNLPFHSVSKRPPGIGCMRIVLGTVPYNADIGGNWGDTQPARRKKKKNKDLLHKRDYTTGRCSIQYVYQVDYWGYRLNIKKNVNQAAAGKIPKSLPRRVSNVLSSCT
jgi:hypothetical protein